MTLTLDLTPAIELRKQLTSGALCTGLMNARPASARDVESFISANLPIVEAGAAA